MVRRIPLHLLGAAALSLICGCEKRTPAASPAVITTPSAVIVAPPAPTPRLAPSGVVYLTKRLSISTENAVTGFPEGTRVEVISRAGDTITGHVNGTVIDVREEDTTNDLDRVSTILKKQADAQAQIQARAASQEDPLAAAGVELSTPKPLSPQEKRAARVDVFRKIQQLQTNIEDAKKQLAELSTLETEQIRKSIPTKKQKSKPRAFATPLPTPDPAVPNKIEELKSSLEGWERELQEARQSVGLGSS